MLPVLSFLGNKMKKVDIFLHADEPVRVGVVRVADGLIQNALERISNPNGDRAEDIHVVRVTIKRLRALLRLIRPVISETAFDREDARLSRAAHRFALARELDVARKTLANLPVSKDREHDALAAVLAGFSGTSEPPVEIDQATNEIKLDLRQTRRDLHRLRVSGGEWKAIGPGLRDVYRECRKRMRSALARGDDEAFHKWRIRVKNLFYELETLQPVWPKRLAKMVADLRELQDEIGADHDLVVVKKSLLETPDAFGGAEVIERVVRPIDDRSRKLRRAVEPLAHAIFNQRPRRFVHKLGQHWRLWKKTAPGAKAPRALPFAGR